MRRTCVVGTVGALVAAVTFVGVGAGVASADSVTLGVSPSTGLADGATVQITVYGATPSELGRVYISECGNAYANGTALPSTVDTTQDCATIGWIDSPFDPTNFTVKEVGIGDGNRSCISGGARACFIYGPNGLNVAVPTPTVPITFAQDPSGTGATPSPTTTTLVATGSPIATGKAQHVHVQVVDDTFKPDGTITVTEGATTVGSGAMIEGAADIVLTPSLGLGSHTLVAHYPGDGSFLASDSDPTSYAVIGRDNISIGDVSVVSGVGGARSMVFPVVLSQVPTTSFTVPYSVVPGTAVPAVDYVAPKSTASLLFRGSATIKYVTVKLLSDSNTGGTKTLTVHLGNPVGGDYVLRRRDGAGTIYDPAAGGMTVSVGDVSIPEGDGGVQNAAKFAITLSAVPTHLVVITVNISSALGDTATKGRRGVGDYNGPYNYTVKFVPPAAPRVGPVMKTVTAQVYPDTNDEPDETFSVQIASVTSDPAQPVSLGRSLATGTILTDE